ncbi:MAG TPA: 2-amino-4-hydroxy-6-hydroxymethyldihydropteridine diphosphokinase [Caulobacteraceae bacterium]|nr:2-amino-4-hydroxy-6-hydroxymethyldihydropteridine diphosphokinase [Caulobacteraceae bacterium]
MPIGHQPRTQRAIARRLGLVGDVNFSDDNTLTAEIYIDADAAVIVALGGNLPGARDSVESLLEAALGAFDAHGLRVVARSAWWRSAAWPDPAEPPYVNGVAVVETGFSPHAVLEALHAIERAFGRKRHVPNAPRTLDLDLIAHGRRIVDEAGFHVPHRRAHERRFVVGPLAQILPGWVHPQLGQTAENLAASAKIGMDAAPITPRATLR